MQNIKTLEVLAGDIIRAQDSCSQLETLASSGRALSMHEAYEVSWIVHEARLKSGWKPIGRKIGFTNRDMWLLFGVTQPVWSFVYDTTYREVDSVFDCPLAGLFQPKIEPEIALCMSKAPAVGATESEVLDCVEWLAHGIEMVQCHYPDWKFTSTDAVCDASFHGKLFVGRKRFVQPGHTDTSTLLKDCAVSLYRGEALVEVGQGRNVLGSPLLAIASLIETIQREGSRYPIIPGEIITTGTITKAYSVNRGEQWHTAFAQNEFPGLTINFV